MKVNKKKLENYVNKLYRGQLPRVKEKIERDSSLLIRSGIFYYPEDDIKGKRVATISAQGKKVIDDCSRKCVVCSKRYDDDPADFEIHHVNGDRTKTYTSNLILLSHSCHKKIHTYANAKLKDYQERMKNKKPKSLLDLI